METIGYKESKWLLFCLMFSGICLESVHSVVDAFGTFGPLYTALAGIITTGFVCLILHFLPDCNFEDALIKAWGHVAANLFLLILFFICLISCMYRLNSFSIAISNKILLNTPREFILLTLSFSVYVVALLKFEAITRYSLSAVIIFLLLLSFVVFSALDRGNINNLKLHQGNDGSSHAYKIFAMYSDIVYFVVISGFIKPKQKRKTAAIKSLFIFTIIASLFNLLYVYVVPYPACLKYPYAMHRLSLVANSSFLFQRLDALIYIVWIFEGFIVTGALGLFGVTLFARIFSLKNQNAVCFSITLICILGVITLGEQLAFSYVLQSIYLFLIVPLTVIVFNLRSKKCLKK